jgi:hypothetical protein
MMNDCQRELSLTGCERCQRRIRLANLGGLGTWTVPVLFEQQDVEDEDAERFADFILDTGAQVTVIPSASAGRLGLDFHLWKERMWLEGAGGQRVVVPFKEIPVLLPGPVRVRMGVAVAPRRFPCPPLLSIAEVTRQRRVVVGTDFLCFHGKWDPGRGDRRRSPRLALSGAEVELVGLGAPLEVAVLDVSLYGIHIPDTRRFRNGDKCSAVLALGSQRSFQLNVTVETLGAGSSGDDLLLRIEQPSDELAVELDREYRRALLGLPGARVVG